MSTILKALKKLENDVPGDDKDQFQIKDIDTREAISKRAKKGQLVQRTVLTLLVVFALSGSVGLLTFGWMTVGKKRFQESISQNSDLTMKEQKQSIYDTLLEYQGEQNRRDDVAIIGFQI